MIKMCPECGAEYEAGSPPFLLPVCPACSEKWDAEIAEREKALQAPPPPENERLNLLGIRPRHYNCTIDSYIPRDQTESRAKAACKKMIESRHGIIVLIGNNGVGKSHLACAVARELGGHVYKMLELGMHVRRGYQQGSGTTEQKQLDSLIALPFLALDEIEKSKSTTAEGVWLSYVVDERNERYRPTMLLGNCHPRSIHKSQTDYCDGCFESHMSPDILDRIAETGMICYLTGESQRPQLRGGKSIKTLTK